MSVAFRSIPYSTDGVLRCQLTWSTQSHANFLTLVAKLNMVKTNQTVCPKTSKRMLSKHALQQIILRASYHFCSVINQSNVQRIHLHGAQTWRVLLGAATQLSRQNEKTLGMTTVFFYVPTSRDLPKNLTQRILTLSTSEIIYFLAYFAKKGIKKFII